MARLRLFEAQRDQSVAEMIGLSARIAVTEADIKAVRGKGARHRHRIDTQSLTEQLHTRDGEHGAAGRSSVPRVRQHACGL